ncbi:MAG: hypothetical protein ACI9VR_002931 [Cognaticolwellia sp.]|jgi:hypothetical protein
MSETSDLQHALEQLTQAGGTGNRLVVRGGRAWFVFHGAKGGSEIRSEAAAKHYLGKEHPLSLNDVSLIRRSGFGQVPPFKTLQRVDAADQSAIIADRTRELLAVAYKHEGPLTLELSLGDKELTENPDLLEAIRGAAGKRTPEARNSLYRALLRSTLLLRLDSKGLPLAVGKLQSWDVFAAFSSLDALRLYAPTVDSFRAIKGRLLFPSLLDLNVGSLLIDPGGRLGGELFRNEVETLARAARPTRSF